MKDRRTASSFVRQSWTVNTSVGGFVALVAPLASGARRDAVPHGPVGIKLHVQLTLLAGHLIVSRLLFAAQRVPLYIVNGKGASSRGSEGEH